MRGSPDRGHLKIPMTFWLGVFSVRMELPCVVLWRPEALDCRVLYPSRGLELTTSGAPASESPSLATELSVSHISLSLYIYIYIHTSTYIVIYIYIYTYRCNFWILVPVRSPILKTPTNNPYLDMVCYTMAYYDIVCYALVYAMLQWYTII